MRRVDKQYRKKKLVKPILFAVVALLVGNIVLGKKAFSGQTGKSMLGEVMKWLQQTASEAVMPLAFFQATEEGAGDWENGNVIHISPYIQYAMSNQKSQGLMEDMHFYEKLLEEQAQAEEQLLLEAMAAENAHAKDIEEPESVIGESEGTENKGVTASEAGMLAQLPFVKVTQKQKTYDWSQFPDTESVIKEFYAIDNTTSAEAAGIDIQKFLQADMTVDKSAEGYHILIFHTHSQEAFADSVPGDKSTTIVGIGELLTKILTEQYGYRVLHHTGEYDVGYRDDAYSKALPAMEQILAQHPEIQVVIDLHRDAAPEGTKYVTTIQGRPTAKFMFFNGLSYTNQTGAIDYLQNDNLSSNLALSFQMQVACNEYFPGLARKIYLKGYRYNMHLKDKYLLVEMGAQTNTVQEMRNACDPLAQTLDIVLSGMVY